MIRLTRNDVARAYGRAAPGSRRSAMLRLEPDPRIRGDSFLVVDPLGRASGSGGTYLTTVCVNLFGSLPDKPLDFTCQECARESKTHSRRKR